MRGRTFKRLAVWVVVGLVVLGVADAANKRRQASVPPGPTAPPAAATAPAPPGAPPQAVPGLPPPPDESACRVTEVKLLTDGGDQDWSPAADLIVYDNRDASGVYQLHTIKPDGSGATCLSCAARPGAPRVDRHKLNPTWHASGRFIVLQGEMDSHPLSWTRDRVTSELILNGLWTNLYAVTPDGQRWHRLTDYTNKKEDGALGPHLSADGRHLLWSQLVERASNRAPFGKWRLHLADFVVDGQGTPSLQNDRDITPAGGLFVEAHGFSPDSQTVIFTADMENTHAWGMDIWTMDLASGNLRNLTKSPHWDEHASYSPSGRHIAYMSSQPYDQAGKIFQTELFLMNPDGSEKRQFTHFNARGHAEYTEERSTPARPIWNADGTRLALTQQMWGPSWPKRRLWLVTFAGPCGG